MRTVASTDGVMLAVHDLGGDGPPLLLCHATGFHGQVWSPLAAELPERRCWALDFRGFGDSSPPADEDFSWERFGEDVLAVVDDLELDSPDAVGHSKGGAALLLAELARPGTFRSLFLFEPIVFPAAGIEGAPPNPLAEITRRRRSEFASYDAALERFRGKPGIGALRDDALEAYVRHGFRPTEDGGITLKALKEHEARTYEMGHGHGTFERLGEVRCPVAVATSGDGGGPAMVAPMVAERLPDGHLLEFPDLAHFGPLEDPTAVAAAVRRWLSR